MWFWSSVCPIELLLTYFNLTQPSVVLDQCIPIELLSNFFNMPQPCVVLVQCIPIELFSTYFQKQMKRKQKETVRTHKIREKKTSTVGIFVTTTNQTKPDFTRSAAVSRPTGEENIRHYPGMETSEITPNLKVLSDCLTLYDML